uniref:HIT-type domain-containing protein n=1 Tax=Plectus sambesii TaxID=2011161 RepID=A0A914V9M1_9BILA
MTAVEEVEEGQKGGGDEEKKQSTEQPPSSSSSGPPAGMCSQCGLQPSKYKCPKCTSRTCSLACSKAHKAADDCDGQRAQWTPVTQADDFSPQVSLEDQQFLHQGVTLINKGKSGEATDAGQTAGSRPRLDKTKQYLLNNCRKRRVWLHFDQPTDSQKDVNQSRHEQFSDTVFWTVQVDFVRAAKTDIAPYSYTVHNIPETLTVATLLRQFLKPKPVGSVVSASDLDADKLAPFQTAGSESVCLFMPVPVTELAEKRFYKVDTSKTLLDNLRNCVVANHPIIVVTLDNEADDFQTITQEEAQQIREIQRQNRAAENAPSEGGRGRGANRRGGRGNNRGNRGGDRGGKRQFDQRPPFPGGDESGQAEGERPFKRGRGGRQRGGRGEGPAHFRGRGRPPFHHHSGGPWAGGPPPGMMPMPPPPFRGGFDPRISRPSFVHNYDDVRAQAGWNNAISPKKEAAMVKQHESPMPDQPSVSQQTSRKPKNYLNILGDDFSDSELPDD